MNNSSLCFKCRISLQEDNPLKYGLHLACYEGWFGLPPQGFGDLNPTSTTSKETIQKSGWNTSFFVGNYRKYSALLGEHHVILKVQQNEAPELPDVEYICNGIAREVGIPNPDFFLIDFNGLRTFVTKNFVRPGTAMDLKHLYHHLPEGAEHFTCAQLMDVIMRETRRYTDLETFINVCLFDSLIGNHDRHGRNLGFLVTPHGTMLSPIYDNNSALGLEMQSMLSADFNPRGKIATRDTTEPAMSDYIKEFRKLGHIDIVQRFAEGVSLERCLNIVDQGFCSDAMKTALKKLIRKRYEEMIHELGTGS